MDIKEDQIQIEKILKGDSSAYRFLVEKNKKIVYSIALRLLNSVEDAEDATQESFIKAYHQLHTFEGKSKFSTWLCTITYRICLSMLKKKSFTSRAINNDMVENHSENMNNPHIDLTEKERQLIVKRCIQKLPDIDALLITLHYFNDNSINEIEEITGLTASNIKIKLFRARKILEQELKFLI